VRRSGGVRSEPSLERPHNLRESELTASELQTLTGLTAKAVSSGTVPPGLEITFSAKVGTPYRSTPNCARSTDQSRELAREGLWVYLSDSRAYHSYRKLQDPSLLSLYPAATRKLRPWMRLHDTAIRHCQEMRKQLDAESDSIRSLIAAASSISSSKDADAQSRFNVLAAIASVGIGLPALVLALWRGHPVPP
jgi:hypothetical protein